jgi:hypothetical protein
VKGLHALADQARWIAAAILLVAVVCDLLAAAYDAGFEAGWGGDVEVEIPTPSESDTTE